MARGETPNKAQSNQRPTGQTKTLYMRVSLHSSLRYLLSQEMLNKNNLCKDTVLRRRLAPSDVLVLGHPKPLFLWNERHSQSKMHETWGKQQAQLMGAMLSVLPTPLKKAKPTAPPPRPNDRPLAIKCEEVGARETVLEKMGCRMGRVLGVWRVGGGLGGYHMT